MSLSRLIIILPLAKGVKFFYNFFKFFINFVNFVTIAEIIAPHTVKMHKTIQYMSQYMSFRACRGISISAKTLRQAQCDMLPQQQYKNTQSFVKSLLYHLQRLHFIELTFFSHKLIKSAYFYTTPVFYYSYSVRLFYR